MKTRTTLTTSTALMPARWIIRLMTTKKTMKSLIMRMEETMVGIIMNTIAELVATKITMARKVAKATEDTIVVEDEKIIDNK